MKRAIGLLAAVVAMVIAASLWSPAQAETWRDKDPAHDHVPPTGENYNGLGDISKVKFSHGPKKVWANVTFRKGIYDEMTTYYNTRKGGGHEYYMLHTYWGNSLWKDRAKGADVRVKCKGMTWTRDGRTFHAGVPRRCIDAGRNVQVKVVSADETYENARDWAPGPGPKAWSPWLTRG